MFGSSKNLIEAGTYKIVNPASGTWAHNFPGGHQGPFRTSITMTDQYTGVYQAWEVTPYEEGYVIRNMGSRNWAYAGGVKGEDVIGFSDGKTKWYIESAGQGKYRVHYPSEDLVWTKNEREGLVDDIILEQARGTEGQMFSFEPL